MTLKHLISLVLAALVCWAAILCGCTQSDDVIFNESNAQHINVQAFFSKSLDSNTVGVKTDTINPGDSVIFLTSVYPSKAIRSRDYFWTKDGEFFAFEYNTKKAIFDPGYHQFNFVFIDFFGDTLIDTLHLYVGSTPELDNKNFIPANNTQYIGVNDFVNFAWNVYDPDSMWDMSHHFVLKQAKGYYKNPKVLVDTILYDANFTYRKGFEPLGAYEWSVSVQNELHQTAQETIHSTLYTKGVNSEAALFGFVKYNSTENTIPLHLWMTNSKSTLVYDETLSYARGSAISIKPLNPGDYTLYTMAKDKPDFNVDSTKISIVANRVLVLDTISLEDTTPPRISIANSLDDTMDYSDTLKFTIKDFGSKVQEKRIKVALETSSVSTFKFSNDTLFVTLPELENSWSTRIISITAYDYSGNKAQETFKINPHKSLPEVFSE
ncbi:MAG: hypothetical protein MJY85_08030 [Fibrobacter sp.]|nr:hypothetical protein [Fibrobacter sp.]